MSRSVHKLFERYLPESIPTEDLHLLIEVISEIFQHQERENRLLERSMLLMSEEMNEINRELRQRLEQTHAIQHQLQEHLVRQKALMDVTPEAILHFDLKSGLDFCNRAAEQMLGASVDEMRINPQAHFDRLFAESHSFQQILASIEQNRRVELHEFIDAADGRYFEFISVPELLDGEQIGRVICLRDLTSMRDSQQVIRHQAFHDALTGLPNRILLQERLQESLEQARQADTHLAVLFIDLDDFKKINDTAGHQAGDQFLIDVSARIQASLREGDVLGRLGGDEFLIILKNINSQRNIIQIHDRILHVFDSPFVVSESQYVVSCSIGISSFPQDGHEPEELIRKADMAMYQAKAQGKNTFHYFDESLERIAIHRVAMESQLRQALEQDQFHLLFQPKVDLNSRRCVGFEALLRWTLPNGSLVYPDQFIPIAEDTGLIKELTLWVLKQSCQTLNRWRNTPLGGLSISINISAIDFADPQFLNNCLQIIGMSGVNPSALEFELTESVFFGDLDKVKTIIQRLKQTGVQIAIDDFGTGYSSLGYLQELDIDYLKIDRSFITSLPERTRAQSLVKSMIDIGINLNIKVVAEGIETKEELGFLTMLGCPIGQGYLFSRPLTEMALLAGNVSPVVEATSASCAGETASASIAVEPRIWTLPLP